MRAYADDEQPELLDQPSFLYFDVQAALFLLGLSLWMAKDFDVMRRSVCRPASDSSHRGGATRADACAHIHGR